MARSTPSGRPPSDPDWYKARNTSGQIGLVPKNYLIELSQYLTQDVGNNGANAAGAGNGNSTAGPNGAKNGAAGPDQHRPAEVTDPTEIVGFAERRDHIGQR